MTGSETNNDYNRNLKDRARALRNKSTLAEVILWNKILKRKQLSGYQFLRQRPINNYIVDFFCKDLNLIIEIDGEIHRFHRKQDKQRETELKELGYKVVRFKNREILDNLYNVERTLQFLVQEIEDNNE